MIELTRRDFLHLSYQGTLGLSILPYVSACKSTVKAPAFIDRILPAPINGGFQDPDHWIWGASVIMGEDGRYHMFASR